MVTVNDVPEELAIAIREFWPTSEWDNAAAIAELESGLDAFAENDTTRLGAVPCGTHLHDIGGVAVFAEHSIGWFQVNACNFPAWPWWRLFNTRHNAGTAHMLWSESGWKPWFFSATKLGLI